MKSPYIPAEGSVTINPGRPTVRLRVSNTGDRAVTVGSHYHFFEANRCLLFDRVKSFGMRLNIPGATAVRFEPGDMKEVELVPFGGLMLVGGFYGLTNGSIRSEATFQRAMRLAQELGFKGVSTDGPLPPAVY